jgi:hypothetical protein
LRTSVSPYLSSRKTRRVTRTGRCTPTKAWSARANDTKSVYYLALFNTEDMPAAPGVIRQTIKPHGSVLLSLSA